MIGQLVSIYAISLHVLRKAEAAKAARRPAANHRKESKRLARMSQRGRAKLAKKLNREIELCAWKAPVLRERAGLLDESQSSLCRYFARKLRHTAGLYHDRALELQDQLERLEASISAAETKRRSTTVDRLFASLMSGDDTKVMSALAEIRQTQLDPLDLVPQELSADTRVKAGKILARAAGTQFFHESKAAIEQFKRICGRNS